MPRFTPTHTEEFSLRVNCDNVAFEDDRAGELARVLRKAADRIEGGSLEADLFDVNGNSVGYYVLKHIVVLRRD